MTMKKNKINTIEELMAAQRVTTEDEINWRDTSMHFKLSESFIEKYADKVDWYWISMYQKLSEAFIEKFADRVSWPWISEKQMLSESFIEKYADKVDWDWISINQKLSEPFIERHADRVSWYDIFRYQKLSEAFIEKFADKADWCWISQYQKLSAAFRKKHADRLTIDKDNWLYKSTAFKKKAVMDTGLYDCCGDYFIAYKGIRSDNYSKFNFQYQYLPGNTYTCHANYTNDENNFGLSAWTEEAALEYCDEKLIKVKIYYKDIARVVHNGGKIRCCKLTVLDEIK